MTTEVPRRPVVYHDGGCPLCNLEINSLKREGVEFEFVDVSQASFDPSVLQTDRATAEYWLHWVDSDGQIYRGYDANLKMWRAAGYRFVGIAEHSWVAPIGRLFYRAFARFRGPIGQLVSKLLAKHPSTPQS